MAENSKLGIRMELGLEGIPKGLCPFDGESEGCSLGSPFTLEGGTVGKPLLSFCQLSEAKNLAYALN